MSGPGGRCGSGPAALIAMRFDCNEIAGTMSEVAAYGTAGLIKPVTQPS
ncbi:heavy metal-binding domain-containing protein [Nocardia sputorum]|nr:heavy metal-binding domain-containing protein [Nocardia sputorum]